MRKIAKAFVIVIMMVGFTACATIDRLRYDNVVYVEPPIVELKFDDKDKHYTLGGNGEVKEVKECIRTRTPEECIEKLRASRTILMEERVTLIRAKGSVCDILIGTGIPQEICFPDCNGRPASPIPIEGTEGNDTTLVNGTDGDDVIFGLGGKDTIRGFKGNDILCGGRGDDTLRGGKGTDILFGNEGNDKLYGENENDALDGGIGNDRLEGGKGDDALDGGPGIDVLKGGSGTDRCDGGDDITDTATDCEGTISGIP